MVTDKINKNLSPWERWSCGRQSLFSGMWPGTEEREQGLDSGGQKKNPNLSSNVDLALVFSSDKWGKEEYLPFLGARCFDIICSFYFIFLSVGCDPLNWFDAPCQTHSLKNTGSLESKACLFIRLLMKYMMSGLYTPGATLTRELQYSTPRSLCPHGTYVLWGRQTTKEWTKPRSVTWWEGHWGQKK